MCQSKVKAFARAKILNGTASTFMIMEAEKKGTFLPDVGGKTISTAASVTALLFVLMMEGEV